MNSRDSREQEIIRSWHANAAAWSEAIRTESIASRKRVTNQAIIDAVTGVARSRAGERCSSARDSTFWDAASRERRGRPHRPPLFG